MRFVYSDQAGDGQARDAAHQGRYSSAGTPGFGWVRVYLGSVATVDECT